MEHTIATIFLPRTTARHIPDIPGWGFVFQQDDALLHRTRDTVAFLDLKVRDFISPTLWSPNSLDLNPDDYSINANALEMCLIDEWRSFDQSIAGAAIASSGAVLSALEAMHGARHTLSSKHKVSAILFCSYQQLLNLWK